MTDFPQTVATEEYSVESETEQHTPSLGESVEQSVIRYLDAMDDQPVTDLYQLVLSEIEAPLLECVLRCTKNNQSQTAEVLGLNRGTLRKKLKKYGML